MLEQKTIGFLRRHFVGMLVLMYLSISLVIGAILRFILGESWTESGLYALIALIVFGSVGVHSYYSNK